MGCFQYEQDDLVMYLALAPLKLNISGHLDAIIVVRAGGRNWHITDSSIYPYLSIFKFLLCANSLILEIGDSLFVNGKKILSPAFI